ncbi:MAG: hypothetical protein QM656_02775 [Paracoccaceae bacterium]
MNRSQQLNRLSQIARITLDRRLADLRQAAEAKSQSEARLRDLAAQPPASDLSPVAAHLAELRWQKWADRRRVEINLVLARQTADWLSAREAAQAAFARGEALQAIRRKFDQLS